MLWSKFCQWKHKLHILYLNYRYTFQSRSCSNSIPTFIIGYFKCRYYYKTKNCREYGNFSMWLCCVCLSSSLPHSLTRSRRANIWVAAVPDGANFDLAKSLSSSPHPPTSSQLIYHLSSKYNCQRICSSLWEEVDSIKRFARLINSQVRVPPKAGLFRQLSVTLTNTVQNKYTELGKLQPFFHTCSSADSLSCWSIACCHFPSVLISWFSPHLLTDEQHAAISPTC